MKFLLRITTVQNHEIIKDKMLRKNKMLSKH